MGSLCDRECARDRLLVPQQCIEVILELGKFSLNKGHIWTGSISIQTRIAQDIEFKYIVALWWNPSTADI